MSFLRRLLGETGTNAASAQQTSVRHDINASEMASRLEQGESLYLLDVREPHEYLDAHIAGAVLIPLGELAQRIDELPHDREIVCICHSGSRSGAATRSLLGAGYHVLNLNGGVFAWMQSGLPVKRGHDYQ